MEYLSILSNSRDATFAAVFVIFASDLYLHAPAHYVVKHVALGLSLLACLSVRVEVVIIAQIVWAIALATSDVKPEAVEAAPKEQLQEDAKPAADTLHEKGKSMVEDSLNKFLKNLDEKVNCDGKPWKLQSDSNGIKVYNSELAGQSTKRWKVETIVKADSIDTLMDELFDFEKRASGSGGWDSAVKSGRVDKVWEDGKYSIGIMSTNAAAGGAISSREFVDVRVRLRDNDHPETETGGVIISSVGIEPKTDQWLQPFPKLDKSATLGRNYAGGGVKIVPHTEPNTYKYTMVNNLNLKGWIPTSLINSATADALLDSHRAMHKHLEQKMAK